MNGFTFWWNIGFNVHVLMYIRAIKSIMQRNDSPGVIILECILARVGLSFLHAARI